MAGSVDQMLGQDDAPEIAPAIVEAPPAAIPVQEAAPLATVVAAPVYSDPMAPVAALVDERLKRQGVERQLQEAQRQLDMMTRQRQESAAIAPHPMDDPGGYTEWIQNQLREVREAVTQEWQERSTQQRSALSRSMMMRHLGDKFGDLAQFIDSAPDAAHQVALREDDPYGWFYEQFQRQEKAKRAESLTAQLGDKSLDDLVAEKLAAAKAEWAAEMSGQPDGRPRNADGTFASPPPNPQRRSAPSLAAVNGASGSAVREPVSSLDSLLHRG